MLYNFNGTLLNVADIVTVTSSKGQRSEYPFVLTVAMRKRSAIRCQLPQRS